MLEPDRVAGLIGGFFAEPNTVDASEPSLRPLLSLLERGVVLLPRVDEASGSGRTRWYAAADDPRLETQLLEALDGYVGRSFASISSPRDASLEDPIEHSLAEAGFGAIVELDSGERNRVALRVHLLALADTLSRLPLGSGARRPVRRVLRDLDAALAAGHIHMAQDALQELRENAELSSLNLAFLTVRVQAAAGDWAGIIAREDVDDLIASRPPRLTTALLCEACYHVFLADAVQSNDVDMVISAYTQLVGPVYGGLLRDPRSATSAAALLLWSAAAAADSKSTELLDALEAQALHVADAPAMVGELLGRARRGHVQGVLSPDELVRHRQYEAAWEAAQRYEWDEPWARIGLLATCALETQREDWIETVLTEFDALSASVDIRPPRLLGLQVERFRVSLPSARIESWTDWVHGLAQPHPPVDELAVSARMGAASWPVGGLLSVEAIERISDAVASGGDAAELMRSVRQEILDACGCAAPAEEDAVRMLLLELAQAIALDARIGASDMRALLEIADRLITLGLSEGEYQDIVGALRIAAEAFVDVSSIGWAVDALDLLASRAATDKGAREAAMFDVLGRVRPLIGSLPDEHLDAIKDSFARAGLASALGELAGRTPEQVRHVPWDALRGQRIFVYTLIEGSCRRVTEWIRVRVDDVRIDCWSEHDADERMIQSARAADIAIVVTRAATHAATIAVEDAIAGRIRPRYPAGTGWSSIVSVLEEEARSLA